MDIVVDIEPEVPQSVLENALSEYRFSTRATTREKRLIRQRSYSREHGEVSVHACEGEDAICCTIETGEEMHSCSVPQTHGRTSADIFQDTTVELTDIELAAVALRADFSFCREAFVAYYWTEMEQHDNGTDGWPTDDFHVLIQEFLPREPTGNPPESTVCPDESPCIADGRVGAFEMRPPNPWAAHSLCVLYEQPDLANKMLGQSEPARSEDEYELSLH